VSIDTEDNSGYSFKINRLLLNTIVFLKMSSKDDYGSQACYFKKKKITFFFRMDIITYMKVQMGNY